MPSLETSEAEAPARTHPGAPLQSPPVGTESRPDGNVVTTLELNAEEVESGCERRVRVGDRWEQITIPAGARDGEVLWFRGRGCLGRDGRRGDLSIRVQADPVPVRGADLGTQLAITDYQALYGAQVPLEFQGRKLMVTVPAQSEAGNVIRIPGEGADGEFCGPSGDLLVVLEVRLAPVAPAELPEDELADLAMAAMGSSAPQERRGPKPLVWMGASVLLAGAVAAALVLPRLQAGKKPAPANAAPAPIVSTPPTTGGGAETGQEPATAPSKPVPSGSGSVGEGKEPETGSSDPAVKQPEIKRQPPVRAAATPPSRPTPPRTERRPVRAAVANPPKAKPAAPASRRFCGRCGLPLRSAARFCARCGGGI